MYQQLTCQKNVWEEIYDRHLLKKERQWEKLSCLRCLPYTELAFGFKRAGGALLAFFPWHQHSTWSTVFFCHKLAICKYHSTWLPSYFKDYFCSRNNLGWRIIPEITQSSCLLKARVISVGSGSSELCPVSFRKSAIMEMPVLADNLPCCSLVLWTFSPYFTGTYLGFASFPFSVPH